MIVVKRISLQVCKDATPAHAGCVKGMTEEVMAPPLVTAPEMGDA
jgi:hypothetical protein